MLLRLFPIFALFVSSEAADTAGIPLGNGNAGITGGGYGDVYGGKVSDGVYGMGGRAGGELGLTGLMGLGSGRRKRHDYNFVQIASISSVVAKPAHAAATAAPGRSKRQIVNTFPMASALASVYGAQAVAGSAAGAGPGRFVPFGSLYPLPPPPPPTTTTTTTPAPTPAPTIVPPTQAPTSEEEC
ncbi:hypothetical protein PRIPAC_90813, partial [Pristionchus pacificus]|uniref:Uncharacterized protein n=1 Tax=Pristionchus pacificus TaxID=54126 RepID=A0A2A6CWU0_PRIPA